MRDRDTAGRPRNARPRDAYGRPLPRGTAGEATMPDDLALPPAEALAQAQRLLDADRPFHAHEVLEAVWKAAPGQERELWRGLAQLAVGLTHLRRGNPRGAVALLGRAADRLAPYAPGTPASRHGIDVAGLVRDLRALAARVEADPPGSRLLGFGVRLGPVSKSPSVASGVQVVSGKADEGAGPGSAGD